MSLHEYIYFVCFQLLLTNQFFSLNTELDKIKQEQQAKSILKRSYNKRMNKKMNTQTCSFLLQIKLDMDGCKYEIFMGGGGNKIVAL